MDVFICMSLLVHASDVKILHFIACLFVYIHTPNGHISFRYSTIISAPLLRFEERGNIKNIFGIF